MDMDELSRAALRAIGGAERVLGVRTYAARIRVSPGDALVLVRRAAGGRIRIDEHAGSSTTSSIVDGDRGVAVRDGRSSPLDAAAVMRLRRDARIAPRNMLAHAGEHELALRVERGAIRIDFPAERVVYAFDAATLLCLSMRDEAADCLVEFADYRKIDGIVTAFFERIECGSGVRELRYETVAFNAEIDDDAFAF